MVFMSKFKGTKGKWKLKKNSHNETNGDEWGWVGLDHYNSHSIGKTRVTWSGNESKANALLISKAPEMLEMLEELVKLHDLGHEIGQYDKAIQLIKEATEL